MQTDEEQTIYVDVYLDNINLSSIGVDSLGLECYSIGVEFSDTGKIMRVFFDDVSWAKEFSFIIELSGKKTEKRLRSKK